MTARPFAAQARALCPEPHHGDTTPCPTCEALERRLQPVTEVLRDLLTEVLRDLLADADLSITVDWNALAARDGAA